MTEFTGERVIPGEIEVDLWNEHLARYAFACRFVQGKRVLDIGCGAGYGSAHLARNAASVEAIDIAADAIAFAREHYPLPNVVFTEASASALPFEPASFDLITCFEVIEHLADWPVLLNETARVLRPDGVLVISTPNRLYYTDSRGDQGPNPFHVHEFDFAEFESALRERFTHVTTLLQNRTECISFYPHRVFPPAAAEVDSTAGSPDTAHFFVSLCGCRPIEPQTFVYVPRAANVLREREQHIRLLSDELAETKQALADSQQAYAKQLEHLEEQNRWALKTVKEVEAAQARIVELQDQLKAEQDSGLKLAQAYAAKVQELEADAAAKAEWARGIEAQLTTKSSELAEALRILHETEKTVEERSRWALDLQNRLDHTEAQLNMVRASRWIRLGRTVGLGPELPQ